MKKAGIIGEQLKKVKIEVYRQFSELIKHQNPIFIKTNYVLTVNDTYKGHPYYVCPLKVTDDCILASDVEDEDKIYEIYFKDLVSIEDKLLLISLMEDNLINP